ncbi:MAG: threonine ammonia-lyase [Thermoplasmatota archaeon]
MITLDDVLAARAAIGDRARNTPLKRSTTLSKATGGDVHLKLESFQRTGSFKVRGALNRIAALTQDEREAGVVAASAGNHAQGVAFAATAAGVRSDVFMPEDAPMAKVLATKAYGARVHLEGRDYQAAQEAAEAYRQERGGVFVHAFDDPLIMAGQGTLGLEVLEALPELDTILVPIGGGGLISGIATAVKATRPEVRVVGVQAAGASTVAPSLNKGQIVPLDEVATMADGIACRRLGSRTFPVIQDLVDEVVTVEEGEIAAAVLFLLERTKVLAEGAGAVTLAALQSGRVDVKGQQTCLVVSGGNIDTTLLGRLLRHGMVQEGRIVEIETTIPDRPGEVARLLAHLGGLKANVLDIHHDRHRADIALHQTRVIVALETKGPEHVERIRASLADAGYA